MSKFVTYETMAGTGAAQSLGATILTSSTGFDVRIVRIYVETAPIRFTLNGTAPVAATTGEVAQVGDVLLLFGAECRTFQFINETGTASSLKMHGGLWQAKEDFR